MLNGIAPISEPLYVQHAALLQRALGRLLAECRSDDACKTSYPEFEQRLAALLAMFENGPLEVRLDGRTVRFSAGDLSYALRGLLYGRGADLALLVERAAAGELAPLAEYYLERTAWLGETGGYHCPAHATRSHRPKAPRPSPATFPTACTSSCRTAGTALVGHAFRR